MEESPIFTKTYDLLLWLIPDTQKFPKDQRGAAQTVRRDPAGFAHAPKRRKPCQPGHGRLEFG